jgi:8-oxo-dGTP pyrophosphatase MutT (NUDIX family)
MSDSDWKSDVVRTLTRNRWFAVLEQKVTRPDGSTTPYFTIDFPQPSVGVVVRRGGDFLMIRQYRFIVREHVWAIPSGGVEPGEEPAAAAAREMEEETGYRASGPLRHLLGYYPSYGCGNQRFELFLADNPVRVNETPDPQEVMGTRWFSKRELLAMIARNGIVDGLSLTPLLAVLLEDAAAPMSP